MFKKKGILLVIVVLIILALLGGLLLWSTSPERTLNKFIQKIESQDYEGAMAYVSDTITQERVSNIDWFLEDWTSSPDTTAIVVTDESWISRKIMTTDENGNEVVQLNEYGNEANEKKPTAKYWAHHYQAYVNVDFDEYEDPVIIKLIRKTDNSWSPLSQIFRGWQVTRIKYQPLDEDNYDYEFDDEYDDFDLEDADFDFEVDEDGNLIPIEIEDDSDDELISDEEIEIIENGIEVDDEEDGSEDFGETTDEDSDDL